MSRSFRRVSGEKPVAVFLFHRDLRLVDNTSLLAAIEEGYKVLPVFIFPPEQIDPKTNDYFSHPAVQFMCESLKDLDQQLHKVKSSLRYLKGTNTGSLSKLYKKISFKAVYSNQDYSKYAIERDREMMDWCQSKGIEWVQYEDYGLLPFDEGFVSEEKPYTVFSPFYKRVMKMAIRPVQKHSFRSSEFVPASKRVTTSIKLESLYDPLKDLAIRGGRTNGLKMLVRLSKLRQYESKRDYPSLEMTSRASPHLKFGTVSIREMYWRVEKLFGKSHGLIRELVFREFYLKIYAFYPKLQRGVALHEKMDHKIPWSYSKKRFEQWAEGRTGFPFVDAGMRELNETGHQHNRLRMLCASVLTKYFLIDWRWGMRYYYQHLVDADIFSNTAGWGFSSSTGPDATPYFRAPFNPFTQSSKFDEDGRYIKKWIPELESVLSRDLHKWYDAKVRAKYPDVEYPAPVVDYEDASREAVAIFKKAGKS